MQQLGGRAFLHQAPGVHHAEPIAQIGMHRQVMGDEQQRGADLALDFADHRQHVLLHDHVQRRGRLIRDDEIRAAYRGQRDGHALPHPAGQFVRIGVQYLGRQMQPLQMGSHTMARNSGIGLAICRKAKSMNVWRTRRNGFSTLIEPCMM